MNSYCVFKRFIKCMAVCLTLGMVCFTVLVSCNTAKETKTNSANHQEETMNPVSTGTPCTAPEVYFTGDISPAGLMGKRRSC
ncbi:MAG: hypothetical protein LBQ88_03120 [Treponema sp.]|jgi:hypothetical protein|nr:hypothetical protein [Treponema sp.]